METKKWIYFGIFLDNESVQKLTKLTYKVFDKLGINENNDWKIFCHHMTIGFNNNSDEIKHLYNYYKPYFNNDIDLVATHIGISDDAIAVKIDYKEKIANKIPHITLATPFNGKPVNSNYITKWISLSKPIKLKGILNQFTNK